MIELISALCKAAGQFSLAWMIGGTIFFWLSGFSGDGVIQTSKRAITRFYPLAAAILSATAAIGLLAQTATTAQISIAEIISNTDLLQAFIFETRAGRISGLRGIVTIALLAFCLLAMLSSGKEITNFRSGAVLILALVIAALGPMTGHTAGSENAFWLTPLHIAHVLAITIWLGGLPCWISLVMAAGRDLNAERGQYVSNALRRFSHLAMICMLIIIATGIVLSLQFVSTQGELLATRYGALICAKLLLLLGVLAIANHARLRLLPRIADATSTGLFYPLAARWIAVELALAGFILGLGSLLSQTTPALHDQPAWWLPFRFSIEATWDVPPTQLVVYACAMVALLIAAIVAVNYKRLSLGYRAMLITAGLSSVAGALWAVSVPAFPDTYRRSEVPYLTISIAKGMAQFPTYCSSCHGSGGLGDGVEASTLPKPPADLSAPHTALHTSGDMFWWLTHGIPESAMPGFAESLSAQDRWDMINFLRAFSQGYEARILSPAIVPRQPWLGAPNFYFESATGEPRSLQDFRGNTNVLLVLPSGDASPARLAGLAAEKNNLQGLGLQILILTDPEIRQSYALLSRTLSNRGDHRAIGFPRQHMEFLIDRFGYIRARWIPEDGGDGWQDLNILGRQSATLMAEPQILPPPSDHVH